MNHKVIWKNYYGDAEWALDYSGRLINKDCYGKENNIFSWNLDHINPQSNGGGNNQENLVPVHYSTNIEKDDKFPHWDANGKDFKAVKKVKNNPKMGYDIICERVWAVEFENI